MVDVAALKVGVVCFLKIVSVAIQNFRALRAHLSYNLPLLEFLDIPLNWYIAR